MAASAAKMVQLQNGKFDALQKIADVRQQNAGVHKIVAILEEEKKEVREKNVELDQTVVAAKIQMSCLQQEKKALEQRLTQW